MMMGKHTTSNPKWHWIKGSLGDKSDTRVEFTYDGNQYRLYVNTGQLVKNGSTSSNDENQMKLYNSKTMLSNDYINKR